MLNLSHPLVHPADPTVETRAPEKLESFVREYSVMGKVDVDGYLRS